MSAFQTFCVIFDHLIQSFYIPGHNTCQAGTIGNLNVYIYVYVLIVFTSLGGYFSCRLIHRRLKASKHLSMRGSFLLTSCIIFFLISTFQCLAQTKLIIQKFYDLAAASSAKERLPLRLKQPYQFAISCQKLFPGVHRGDLITDMDLTKDPGMFIHRALAYYLYPIDIRSVYPNRPKDCVIIFLKKNPEAQVPADFEILFRFDDSSLLAVKKKAQSGMLNRGIVACGTVAKCPKRPNPRQPHHRENSQNFSKKAISQQSPCRDVPVERLVGGIVENLWPPIRPKRRPTGTSHSDHWNFPI